LNKSLVSIVIPNYNKEEYIKESIDSALNQTYRPIEIIVVDDGSTDNSKEIIKSCGKKIKAYFLPHKNANAARNFGFRKSKGKYIQFLDSDDVIHLDKIEKQVNLLERTKADIALCYWRHITNKGEQKEVRKTADKMKDKELFLWLLKGNWFNPATPLYVKSFIDWEGPWDKSLKRAQDTDFHFQIALRSPKVVTVKEILALYRKTDERFKRSNEYAKIWGKDSFKVYKKLIPFVKSKEQKRLLAKRLYKIARGVYDIDYTLYKEVTKFAFSVSGDFIPNESKWFLYLYGIFGREITESLASIKRRIISKRF